MYLNVHSARSTSRRLAENPIAVSILAVSLGAVSVGMADDSIQTVVHEVKSQSKEKPPEPPTYTLHKNSEEQRLEPFIPKTLKPAQSPKKILGLLNELDKDAYLAVIVGEDGRKQVKNTTIWPYSAVGMILTQWAGKKWKCSGSLVNKHHVLTAGHCVYDASKGGWAEAITFYPAKNGSKEPFPPAKAVTFISTSAWTDAKQTEHDYAMVTLDRNVGDKTGWFGLISLSPSVLKDRFVNVTGYPGDKDEYTMWTHRDAIKQAKEKKLEYYADIMRGQSGSPIWLSWPQLEDKFYVVGINAYEHEDKVSPYNLGPRMDDELIERIVKWIEKY